MEKLIQIIEEQARQIQWQEKETKYLHSRLDGLQTEVFTKHLYIEAYCVPLLQKAAELHKHWQLKFGDDILDPKVYDKIRLDADEIVKNFNIKLKEHENGQEVRKSLQQIDRDNFFKKSA